MLIFLGVPRLIRRNMVKPGACVIDVGMTRVYDKDGKPKFIGDVDFEGVEFFYSYDFSP